MLAMQTLKRSWPWIFQEDLKQKKKGHVWVARLEKDPTKTFRKWVRNSGRKPLGVLGYRPNFQTLHYIPDVYCLWRLLFQKISLFFGFENKSASNHLPELKNISMNYQLVVATHLKNMLIKLDHFSRDRGENSKNLRNHENAWRMGSPGRIRGWLGLGSNTPPRKKAI